MDSDSDKTYCSEYELLKKYKEATCTMEQVKKDKQDKSIVLNRFEIPPRIFRRPVTRSITNKGLSSINKKKKQNKFYKKKQSKRKTSSVDRSVDVNEALHVLNVVKYEFLDKVLQLKEKKRLTSQNQNKASQSSQINNDSPEDFCLTKEEELLHTRTLDELSDRYKKLLLEEEINYSDNEL